MIGHKVGGDVLKWWGWMCHVLYFLTVLHCIALELTQQNKPNHRPPPPQVLPTSSDDGLVEYVPSVPLSRILAEHKTIHRWAAAAVAVVYACAIW